MFDGATIHKPRIREVQAVVAAMHGLPVSVMWSQERRHDWAHPRQEAMALARELTGRSYPEIGLVFGNRDHTTILYAHRKVRARAKTDAALAKRLADARVRIAEVVAERVANAPAPPPSPPVPLAKPHVIRARIDLDAWARLGGELEAAS